MYKVRHYLKYEVSLFNRMIQVSPYLKVSNLQLNASDNSWEGPILLEITVQALQGVEGLEQWLAGVVEQIISLWVSSAHLAIL